MTAVVERPKVTTAVGQKDGRVLVAELVGGFVESGMAGWLPQTSLPWLEAHRRDHEAAVWRREVRIGELPTVLAELDDELAAFERASADYRRRARAALGRGETLPVEPRRPDPNARAWRLDEAWGDIDTACSEVARTVACVERDLLEHSDELWRSHLAHVRRDIATATTEQKRVAALHEAASHGALARDIEHIRGWVASVRADVDPASARRVPMTDAETPSGYVTLG